MKDSAVSEASKKMLEMIEKMSKEKRAQCVYWGPYYGKGNHVRDIVGYKTSVVDFYVDSGSKMDVLVTLDRYGWFTVRELLSPGENFKFECSQGPWSLMRIETLENDPNLYALGYFVTE